MTNCLIVGFGSIGARHHRVLKSLGYNVGIVSQHMTGDCFRTVEEGLSQLKPDYIVIANETSKHAETLRLCLTSNAKILVEKPIGKSVEELAFIANDVAKDRCYVAYNLRFHDILQTLKSWIADHGKLLTVRCVVGQYLPSWRPDQDYRQSYSATKARGGGVLRDLSHELDYLQWLCGDFAAVCAAGGKVSNLEIDSEDLVSVLLRTTRDIHLNLQLSYIEQTPCRLIDLVFENSQIKADLIAGQLFSTINGQQNFVLDRDHSYLNMHRAVLREDVDVCRFQNGMSVLNVIERIERSLARESWEYL